MKRVLQGAGVLFLAFLILPGCTVSRPEIVELFWLLEHRFDVRTGEKSEELVFFGHFIDNDGEDDIESVYLVSDGNELYWRLQSDSWDEVTIGEDRWIGNSRIEGVGSGGLPRGAFRVIVVDRAGERAESSIYVSSERMVPEETKYPSLEVRDGEIEISSPTERTAIWFYDGSGAVVKQLATTSRTVLLSGVLSQGERKRAVGVSVFSYDDSSGIGAISGVYPIHPIQ